MLYDIFINGVKVDTCGHPQVENLTLSLSGSAVGVFVFAGAVCSDDGSRFHYSWAQHDVGLSDTITFSPSDSLAASTPVKKFELARVERKTLPSNTCAFCQRAETEVERLIIGNENIPGICSDCVTRCVKILDTPTA